ncbi:uncharacterized protein LOC109511533 isoform X2 [Hippocampus comes]|uniref:uncharacterized protein LOC109511533 isoform X2 n=1 Tax=Hippocampus comes TaxID=109280 RepID=UPI00094E8432|nr:PREDICTED: uncharacterized protein LOC109511533 isoform X2 [Hippocampus comes]
MEYFFLKGFLVVLFIKHCTTSDGVPTSTQSSRVTLEDTHTSPREPGWSPAEVMSVVAPPSLEEVQQAVQEASEKVEGGAAEEFLKELLERVVEAALGQVEGKWDELAVQEGAEEDAVGFEDETQVEVSERMVLGMDAGHEEEQEAKEREGEALAVSMEKTTVGVDTVEVEAAIVESVDAKVSQKVVEETTIEGMGKDVALDDEKVEDSNMQVVMLNGRVQTATTPIVQALDVGGEPVRETGADSELNLVAEEIGRVGEIEEDAAAGDVDGGVIALPSDNPDIEVVEELAVSEENYIVKDPQSQDDVEESYVEEEVESIELEGGEVDSKDRESYRHISEEYEVLVNGGDERQAGVEEVTSQTSNDLKEGPETTVISAPEPENDAGVNIGQKPDNQGAAAPSAALSEVAENVFNEILCPTDDLVAGDPNVAHPTLEYFVKNVLAIPPQARGELVEDTAEDPEIKVMVLEAWKIGATIAVVFLLLETVVIIIYIFKGHNKNSGPAEQRSCEEGCVEAEVTTGGDNSDDTLHAGNGDLQQYVM